MKPGKEQHVDPFGSNIVQYILYTSQQSILSRHFSANIVVSLAEKQWRLPSHCSSRNKQSSAMLKDPPASSGKLLIGVNNRSKSHLG